MVCAACGAWVEPILDHAAQTVRCPDCSHTEPRRFGPLFIVTGASGVGKTTIVPELQRLLTSWDIFETDILWDSGGDWEMIKCNWLRIVHSIAQSCRPVILCGTIIPANLENCDTLPAFTTIYYLALHCYNTVLAERLSARPAWRGFTEALIETHLQFNQWLLDNADTAFEPPLSILDTTRLSPQQAARAVREGAVAHWRQEPLSNCLQSVR
jgi:hypothetical protein